MNIMATTLGKLFGIFVAAIMARFGWELGGWLLRRLF